MGKKNKKGGDGGLPGWFATYSDMMTLLFAFFVLLFSLSTLDPVKLAEFGEGGDERTEVKDLAEIKQEFEKMIEELNMDSTATISQDPRGFWPSVPQCEGYVAVPQCRVGYKRDN